MSEKPNAANRVRSTVALIMFTFVSAVAGTLWFVLPEAFAQPQMNVRDRYLVGNELRILVDTAQVKKKMGQSSAEASKTRGWFIAIDLAKPGPLLERARVIGPLWSTDSVQSELSFSIGVRFTADDVAAGKARPLMGFDDRGELIRQVLTPEGSLIVERCDTTKTPAVWTKFSDASQVGEVGKDWIEGVLRNPLARTLVQEEADGKIRAYDLFAGTPQTDPWLTESFADLRGRKDFHNTTSWLTNDSKYIVARPCDVHNTGGKLIESFQFEGKTYSRADYGLIYTRPETKPALFRKPVPEGMFLMELPQGAFSIDGELMLLEVADSSLRLFTSDGATRYAWTKHDTLRWRANNAPYRQLDASAGRLIFYSSLRDIDDRKFGDDHEIIVIWDYKGGQLRREIVELSELFDIEGGTFVPKSVAKYWLIGSQLT